MSNVSENKICQNCKKDFTIESDDFLFYEKMKVPAPTFCPHCRFVRRMIWRNERSLYKRKCDMCQKNIIAMYDDKVPFPVYCPECWRSDKWEAGEYTKDYDFSKPFFEQWEELFNKVPRQGIRHLGECIDSEYANFADNSKNVYLSYSVLWNSEGIYYSNNIEKSKEIIDSFNATDSELIYQSINVLKNYSCQYSYWSLNCINCNFILDCNNCQDCFGCVNLQNKRYCIYNEQYSKEEYEEKIKSFNTGSRSFIIEFSKEFWSFSLNFPRRYVRSVNCNNSTGDVIRDSSNSKSIFNSYGCENIKYGYRVVKSKDGMDVCYMGAELAYEHGYGGSENSQNIKFTIEGQPACSLLEYSDACKSSSNLFGCIGLKNKQYCILNKQYEKEEYFKMVEKIKKHMDDMPYIDSKSRVYKYGEFFPYELCPFGYNEAVINDHFPLTKEEILERGYPYKEKQDNKYTITLKAKDIPDDIKDVDDSILNEVIECEVSGKAFKITPFEFQFYRRMNIPIPRLHPNERYKKRLALRNPMILYTRACMHEGCTNTFETTYAPNRPEIIYCKECYQREVY
ncbi:TPA: hypothetical protein DEP30_00010 [Candidatus Nomurabacteria bacterium]|nr:MAG: hypothetical protein UR97_C0005G0016 [Candidatus Nomurabacteria bacterium GW2011_GWE2_36_115]KKP93731.1 MAG: hypothetical protein US00_C0005G0016 [Candidatus Nomurabacteria bacterium GW2011_GWF2_36_126]KKP97200.1 MAG: hypothetical protein US04_C0001G0703 [Candidatus Nomurabacteria bacterium GW2011_GWD2_36_14]KKP99193.1 MAG: hypothetical protein US08_C0002G0016 [Candidatus Nomurabacteria bacterium GW2011_GWF2_36_19]KKQ05840.1 MAG: hypothetical protein US17_C0001G0018 [Candidatus Nomuraba